MMNAQPQAEHRWLDQLVGEWTFEVEATMAPGQPAEKCAGRERVRRLGDLWIVAEGEGEMPGGGTGRTLMTLGYDTFRKRYTGSWAGSMMTCMWVYDGALDASGRVLTLETEGPDFVQEGKMTRYRDVIEVVAPDQRLLRSLAIGPDSRWTEFMLARYRRNA